MFLLPHRSMLIFGLCVSACLAVVFGLGTQLWHLMLCRALLGGLQCTGYMCSVIIGGSVSPDRRAQGMSIAHIRDTIAPVDQLTTISLRVWRLGKLCRSSFGPSYGRHACHAGRQNTSLGQFRYLQKNILSPFREWPCLACECAWETIPRA